MKTMTNMSMIRGIKWKKRKNFYSNELDFDKMNRVLNYVIENLTLKEILKMVREISYDMVCYYNEDAKGIIYRDDNYTEDNRYQACQLQRLLATACDLFGQSVIDKRQFEEGYLNKWLNGGIMERKIDDLMERNRKLEEKLNKDGRYVHP